MKYCKPIFSFVLMNVLFFSATAFAVEKINRVGSLAWTEKTGGHLNQDDRNQFYSKPGVFGLAWGSFDAFSRGDESGNEGLRVDPALLHIPAVPTPESIKSDIVEDALNTLLTKAPPELINHSLRTAYWTVVILKNSNPNLTDTAIEEAWVAGILHDIGSQYDYAGDVTVGSVAILKIVAARHPSFSQASIDKVAEAITLNPNLSVSAKEFGLLAWAMNVAVAGAETVSPFRNLMALSNIRDVENRYPRDGFKAYVSKFFYDEAARVPDGRFAELIRMKIPLLVMRKDH